ncbi:unnamed protein product [Ectocarpus sp. 4 AP-2014]
MKCRRSSHRGHFNLELRQQRQPSTYCVGLGLGLALGLFPAMMPVVKQIRYCLGVHWFRLKDSPWQPMGFPWVVHGSPMGVPRATHRRFSKTEESVGDPNVQRGEGSAFPSGRSVCRINETTPALLSPNCEIFTRQIANLPTVALNALSIG